MEPNQILPEPLSILFRKNRIYLLCFALFLLGGGIWLASNPTGAGVLYFSNHRNPFLDHLFIHGTKLGEEIGYVTACLLLALFLSYRAAAMLPLLGIFITIAANLLKGVFRHPRPKLFYKDDPLWQEIQLVAGVVVHGGANGFPSGHTMGGFALFTFLAFCARKKTWAAVLLFLLALLVGLSRVYLVQHFFKDVYFGSMVGLLAGLLFYYLQFWLIKPEWKKWDRSLLSNWKMMNA